VSSILLVADRKSPSIPTITGELNSHTRALETIRDILNVRERRTGDKLNSFVRVRELIDLGLVRVVGGNRIESANGSSSGSGGASALSDLTDVDLTGLSDGDVLIYDATYGLWLPGTVSGGGGGGGSGNVTPDTHPASANAADDEFETGTTIDTAGTRFSGATAWAWRNQGSATGVVVPTQGSLVLTAPTGSGDSIRVVEQPISGAGRWRARIGLKSSGGFSTGGLALVNSGNGKLITVSKQQNGQGTESSQYSSVTSFSGGANGPVAAHFGGIYAFSYFEVEYDGTNVAFRISGTGVDGSFYTIRSEAAASFLGTPDKVAICCNSNNGSDSASTICDWFRKMP